MFHRLPLFYLQRFLFQVKSNISYLETQGILLVVIEMQTLEAPPSKL